MITVTCPLCPRHCALAPGQHGDCRARANAGGKIISLNYAAPCTVHVDPIEKKPSFHTLPGSTAFSIGTAGCNLHCLCCQNWEISQCAPTDSIQIPLTPEEAVINARAAGCRSIAYTYTEPLVSYEYTLDTARLARQNGLKNILVTAAYIEQAPLTELCRVTDAASVNLKGITEDFYRKMCSASLKPVQKAILTMKKNAVWVEIINLIIPGWNDSDQDLRQLVRWIKENCGRETPLHFSRFWPQHKLENIAPTPEATITLAREIALAEGLDYVYVGNNTGNHPGEDTYCPVCRTTLLKRHRYELLANHLINGCCSACHTPIPGLWD